MLPRRPGRVAPAILACAIVLGACSGGGGNKRSVVPPPPAPTVLPAADRIRLGQTRLGGPAPCLDDAYCAAGLTRVYGIDLGPQVFTLADAPATLAALSAGAIDVGVLPRSSAATTLQAARLTDDRHLVPAANIIPIASPPLAAAAAPTLNGISARIDQAGLDTLERGLASGDSAEQVAAAWLAAHGYAATAAPPAPGAPAVVVGVEASPDQAALADLYAGALGAAGIPVRMEQIDGGIGDVLDAFSGGRINLAVESLAPALEYVSGFTGVASADVSRNLTLLRAHLADVGLAATTPAPASPGVVFVVSPAVSRALNLSSLSDLARASGARLPAEPPPTTTTSTPTEVPSTTTTPTTVPSATAPPTTVPSATVVPASAAPIAVGPQLGVGAAGAPVAVLQRRLIALGYRVLPTGTFDEGTRKAVVGFQLDQDLMANGVDDAPTQRALTAARPTAHPSAYPAPGDANSVRPPEGAVYLAFAGGPSAATAPILQALNRRSARATFFADDGAIARHPDDVRSVSAANGVGVSTPPHNATSAVAEDVLLRSATRGREDLAGTLRKTSNCMLAPYGATDARTRAGAADRGLKPVLTDIDPQDWRRPGARAIAADVIDNVRPGSIVLLHDGGGDRSQTVEALTTILDTLEARGYTFAAIPDCVV